jgi:hypothetical protein
MNARPHIPDEIQHRIFDRSRRRCALCIHFNNDWGQKQGQIAHLDQDPSNVAEDNLAFLCLPHHNDYDTTPRQTKKLTIREAKTARDRLYEVVAGGGDLTTAGHQSSAGRGGDGGGAKVVGNRGTAIGGPGAPPGKYGRGGDGGSAEVHGDDALAAGGAGGAPGEDNLWRPPAKSGYEIAQRALGRPVDPFFRQFGRGAPGAGYQPKLEIVEQLRLAYFNQNSIPPKTIFEDIEAVPLDFLNNQLSARSQDWRVRIIDDEYEFYVPKDSNTR